MTQDLYPSKSFVPSINMPDQDFAALVTGGASGIGEATVRKLASRGVSVLIGDLNSDRGEKLAAEVRELYNVRADFFLLDVTDEANVRSFVEQSTKWTGRLDFAANCAGICESVWEEEESITAELFDR
jgi:NAD(P)-dependent dehydrogenase (short-subunit alcohol dehydrogenase family)